MRAPGGKDIQLLVVEVDAMREHGPSIDAAEVVEVAHDRPAVARRDIVLLEARLGAMGAEDAAAFMRHAPGGLEVLGADRVGAVRHGGGEHVVRIAEFVEEAPGFGHALVDRQRRDAGRVEEDAACRDAHADGARRLHRLERVPEHIHDGGDAAEQQFGKAQHAAQIGGARIEDRRLGLPHGLEPRLERQVLDQAAEQAIRRVAMGVDDARHQDMAGPVDDLRRPLRERRDVRRRSDCRDAALVDRHAAVGDDRTGAVGGDDEGISNDEIGHVRLFLYHHEIAVSTASVAR